MGRGDAANTTGVLGRRKASDTVPSQFNSTIYAGDAAVVLGGAAVADAFSFRLRTAGLKTALFLTSSAQQHAWYS